MGKTPSKKKKDSKKWRDDRKEFEKRKAIKHKRMEEILCLIANVSEEEIQDFPPPTVEVMNEEDFWIQEVDFLTTKAFTMKDWQDLNDARNTDKDWSVWLQNMHDPKCKKLNDERQKAWLQLRARQKAFLKYKLAIEKNEPWNIEFGFETDDSQDNKTAGKMMSTELEQDNKIAGKLMSTELEQDNEIAGKMMSTELDTDDNVTSEPKSDKIENNDDQRNRTTKNNSEEKHEILSDGLAQTVNVRSEILNYPNFYDEDDIPYYCEPFTLKEWLDKHEPIESRWSVTYNTWLREDKLGINKKGGEGDRPRREVLLLLQSVLIAVLDYHQSFGYHGSLDNLDNYNVEQFVIDVSGRKVVKFRAQLLNGKGSDKNVKNMHDDLNVICSVVFQKILDGYANSEINHLKDLLVMFYGTNEREKEKLELLFRDYPGFWDGNERVCFCITLYFHIVSSKNDVSPLQAVLDEADSNMDELHVNWRTSIPKDSVFMKILSGGYHDHSAGTILRYISNVFQHFKEETKKNEFSVIIEDIRHIELAISQIFPLLIVALYKGMCQLHLFLP